MNNLRLGVRGYLMSFPLDWHLRRYLHHCNLAERHDEASKRHVTEINRWSRKAESLLAQQEVQQ